ncbi:uncharacterized protein PADG_01527 [Paracoccidioides brasiliensis Pb18]|uniref:Uncharacterized protein n=1 Tax=Paracoccidioides brasiliensis (strain Pb18) TaxID=502780 RepID=C1G3L1_PARBD|nr:uncharacterized protein PADG_01527 [Paracoccidioides brasiliensis Pb18]EEH45377.1 hypothetical protein PADG_01527 [Paracoccidioides brasiliensis Pb18]
MQCEPFINSLGLIPGRHGRSVSLCGDVYSPIQSMRSPPPVQPEPQFIAATSAAQIVSADQNLNGLNPSAGTIGASLSPASLTLLNRFLDNLLFNILMTAKSTNLNAIRLALAEVLKPRLAKEVVSAADDELSEYMGGGEDEELSDFRGGREPAGHFELERSWKLTRLRCMVYTRLGDMEEEDEDEHLHREGLNETDFGRARFSNYVGHITPAAAIFLTSILEYLGEHSLIIAGEAAATRLSSGRSIRERDEHSELTEPDMLVVEETDMEKLALNPTLGRLWRTWRKNVRAPVLSRTLSRESMIRRGLVPLRGNSRASSIGTIEEPSAGEASQKTLPLEEVVNPADVPIPESENDVDEIEVPGFTTHLSIAVQARSFRPRSLFLSGSDIVSPTSTGSPSHSATLRGGINESWPHSRSQSLPSSPCGQHAGGSAKFFSSLALSPVIGPVVGLARDEPHHLETMIEDDELPDRLFGEASYPPGIPPRSKQRRDRDNIEDDPENSDHSEFYGSANPSRLQSPQFLDGQSHEVELSSQRSEEYNISPSQTIGLETTKQHGKSKSSRGNANSQHSQRNVDPKSIPPYEHEVEPCQESSASSQGSIVETSFVAQTSRAAAHPSRLTPHQEFVKNSNGASDQESPYSYTARRSASIRSRQSLPRSNSRQNTTPRYTQPNSAASVGSERAAVQRVSPPPPSTPRDSSSKPRRSVSISSHRDKRPITSGSATSQVSNKLKGLVGWQASDSDSKVPLPIRTSTDTNGTQSKVVEAVPDPSNLDELIQSDETIRYTLTPRNMRDMEDPNSPRWAPTRTETTELADFLKTTGPPEGTQSDSGRPSVSSSNRNGLRIHTPSPISPVQPKHTQSPVANTSHPQPPSHKPRPPQARDARVERESLRDFAEFIRSTGPEHTTTVPKNNSRPATSLTNVSNGPVNRTRHAIGGGAPSATSVRSQKVLTKELPKRPTPRLEARSALTPKDDGTSDLIDFIREGPPEYASHRIPRTVAPFRTTMDSDELQYLSISRANRDSGKQSSVPSANAESVLPKSVSSSFNSRTGLLESTNRINNRTYNGQPASNGGFEQGESGLPVRKQRCVKDPYAIDFDSDDGFDDDLLSRGLKAHKEEEESLADFLRNAAPPPDFDQHPPLLSVNANAVNKAKLKSTTSMRSRLMRATSVDKVPSTKLSRSSLRSHRSNATTVSSPAGPTTPIPEASGPKGFLSSSQHNNFPPHPAYSARIEHQRNGTTDGFLRSQLVEPRNHTRANQTSTADLADFLKNTGPPESLGIHSSRSSVSADREKRTGVSIGKIFSRRKRQAV